jgi:hypothetical protein
MIFGIPLDTCRIFRKPVGKAEGGKRGLGGFHPSLLISHRYDSLYRGCGGVQEGYAHSADHFLIL